MNIGLGLGLAIDEMQRESRRIKNEDEDRAYQKGQRAHQEAAQQRQRTQWAREDATNEKIAAIPTTKTIPGQATEDAAGNMINGESQTRTVNVPIHRQLRDMAEVHRTSGAPDGMAKYLELTGKADELAMRTAANRVTRLEAVAGSMSALDIGKAAQQIFNDDPFPFQIADLKDSGDGGVIATFKGEDGTSQTQRFANSREILDGLKSIYNPQAWQALQQLRQQAAAKSAEELNKPYTLKPGEKRMVGGREIARGEIPVNHEYIGEDVNGNPQYRRIPNTGAGGGAGAGSGRGKGGSVGDRIADGQKVLESVLKDSAEKLPIEQHAQVRDYWQRMMTENSKIPPEKAAKIAVAITLDPSRKRIALNPMTGMVDTVFNDGVDGEVAIERDIANPLDLNRIPPEMLGVSPEQAAKMTPADLQQMRQAKMKELTGQMIARMPAADAAALMKAARDPDAAAKLIQKIRDDGQAVLVQRTANASKADAEVLKFAIESSIEKRIKAIENLRNLFYNYAPKPDERARGDKPVAAGIAAAAASASKFLPKPMDPLGLNR